MTQDCYEVPSVDCVKQILMKASSTFTGSPTTRGLKKSRHSSNHALLPSEVVWPSKKSNKMNTEMESSRLLKPFQLMGY
ncbi:hypothetical protein Pcinc_010666 [Petrolisthes cinctipes]|uniref:Uncharacterized protein n=1 Tax=Petrolisthes cinctipes TaxID=88211 RepID=A0AAE1KX68_PETCI|nr:hypothetical protein Pcinc_010666 [Petrolisthes cinctipes]